MDKHKEVKVEVLVHTSNNLDSFSSTSHPLALKNRSLNTTAPTNGTGESFKKSNKLLNETSPNERAKRANENEEQLCSSKRLKTRHRSDDISASQLWEYFDKPIEEVAKIFGICTTLLKKICRKHGIYRWPFRQIRSLDRSIECLKIAAMNSNQESETASINLQIKTLEKRRHQLMINQPEFDDANPNQQSYGNDCQENGADEDDSEIDLDDNSKTKKETSQTFDQKNQEKNQKNKSTLNSDDIQEEKSKNTSDLPTMKQQERLAMIQQVQTRPSLYPSASVQQNFIKQRLPVHGMQPQPSLFQPEMSPELFSQQQHYSGSDPLLSIPHFQPCSTPVTLLSESYTDNRFSPNNQPNIAQFPHNYSTSQSFPFPDRNSFLPPYLASGLFQSPNNLPSQFLTHSISQRPLQPISFPSTVDINQIIPSMDHQVRRFDRPTGSSNVSGEYLRQQEATLPTVYSQYNSLSSHANTITENCENLDLRSSISSTYKSNSCTGSNQLVSTIPTVFSHNPTSFQPPTGYSPSLSGYYPYQSLTTDPQLQLQSTQPLPFQQQFQSQLSQFQQPQQILSQFQQFPQLSSQFQQPQQIPTQYQQIPTQYQPQQLAQFQFQSQQQPQQLSQFQFQPQQQSQQLSQPPLHP